MAEDLTLSDINSMLQELYHASGAPYFFDAPFIGIAAADDPFFVKYFHKKGDFPLRKENRHKIEKYNQKIENYLIKRSFFVVSAFMIGG